MAYHHGAFPYPMEQPPANMYFTHPVQFAPFLRQPHPIQEVMFPHQPYLDYVDFMPLGLMPEDYDDGTEVSTRPRLTKEQVEVLESQFQAHPKPNSMVKKQLAVQTKLTLPRVANWFQNRRAKAKQQRKQEEFETQQNSGVAAGWKSESSVAAIEASSKASSPARRPSIHGDVFESKDSKSPSRSPTKSPNRSVHSTSKSRWISSRTETTSDEADHQQRQNQQQQQKQHQRRTQEQFQAMLAMPPPELPHYGTLCSKSQRELPRAHTSSLSPPSDWSQAQNLNDLASSPCFPLPAPVQDLGFDFGFDQDLSSAGQSSHTDDSPDTASQHYVVSPETWANTFSVQTSSMSQQADFAAATQTSPLPLPAYPNSRRGSGADELTANLGTFALTGTPPSAVAPLNQMVAPIRPMEGEIDIASRRKRPRPAALTSAALTSSSLRSRSYGQLSSTSPAFRSGPPSGNALRHVKSTGHSLNTHYAGIRKSSLPQKSPLNLSSFAEAETLKRLMAQQAAAASTKTPLTTPSRTDMGPGPISQEMSAHLSLSDDSTSTSGMGFPSEVLAQYKQMQSPPHTPFHPEYMMQAAPGSMPPPSARSQYASIAECTPPYSAGPLTNSTCWSDAPLHSPDLLGFPSGHFMSSMAFTQQQEPPVQQWILPSDQTTDVGFQQIGVGDEHKKTEFFITEFPGQREEYASIAQHVSQPRPKNYVFANTAPSDYDC